VGCRGDTYKLDETVLVVVCLCSRVGGEWELSNLVLDTGLLELFLVLSDPCDFRMGVDDRWNSFVVDVAVAVLDVFDSGDTCSESQLASLYLKACCKS
jgi:hypothetical protein